MRFGFSLSLGILCWCIALNALAQSEAAPPEPPPGYDRVIDQAVSEFAAGHWEEARALFLEAHAMFPNARTLRGIGMSSYELRDYPESVRTLEEALTSSARPLTPEQRAQVTELRERAAAFVGRYEVPAAPASARLYLDGEHVTVEEGWPASPGHVLLGIGEHQVAIRLDDGRSSTARVVVRGHTETALDIDLAPLTATTPAPPPPTTPADPPPIDTTPPPPPSVRGPDLTPWIVMGVGVAVAIGGAIALALGENDIATVQNAARGTPWTALDATYQRAPIETGVGGSLLGVGLATAVVGLIWGIAQSGPTSARDEALRVDVGLGSVSMQGSF